MKRVLAILLATVLAVTSLAACSTTQSTETQKATETVKETEAAESTDASEVPVEPTVYYASDGQEIQMGGTLTFGLTFNGDFFNPYYQGSAINYCWPAMEPLAYYRSYDGSWKPCLAESWERDTETSLTIHLNKEATWSDGTPFTAADVIATWDARFQYGTQSVIGSPSNYEALDDYTVRIEWESFSLSYEVWALCQYVYQKKAMTEHDADWMNTNIVGTGPYVLESFVPDQELVFVKNDNYWGDPAGPDKIVTKYISDSTAMLAAFVNEEIDSITVRDETTMVTLALQGYTPNDEPVTQGTEAFLCVISHDENDPLANEKIRQAIYHYAIDWDSYAKIVGGSLGYHTDCIGLTTMSYYKDTLETSSYDLEKFKQILTEEGYPDGFHINIYCRTSSNSATVAVTTIDQMLKEAGLDSEIVLLDGSLSMGKILNNSEYTSGLTTGSFTYTSIPQMDRFTKHINPNGTFGPAVTCSEERMEAWEKVSTAKTQEEEDEWLYKFVELYVHEECTLWPTYSTDVYTYSSSKYHYSLYKNTASSGVDPHEIWVEE